MSAPRGILLASLLAAAAPALAQSPGGAWSDVPGRFRVDVGYFRIGSETVLRFNGAGRIGSDIDFERDLGVDADVDTFWVDATWRVGRRHQLELGYTSLNRERDGHTLTRDFQWGGETFNAGLSTSTETGSQILGGYYRFAVFRNERFEIGPTVGIGYLWLDARVRATGSITGPVGGGESRTLDRSASTGHLTGCVGGYATAWPLRRLALHADYLYIKVNPENSEASVTDGRLGANYYIFRNAGIGVQYKYYQYRYDRDILSAELGGEATYQGFQGFLSFLF